MCGIAGAADLKGDRAFDPARLEAMLRAIAHRGPDGEGTHLAPGIALGARRLALVDPAGGAQPVSTPEGDFWAVANGEILNDQELRAGLESEGARFRSRCDAELWPHLLRRSRAKMLRQVRGQFAIAIWDAARRELLLRGKRLLRAVAAKLGVRTACAPKTMFRADRSALVLGDGRPAWVDELLSRESIARVGWFDFEQVGQERARRPRRSPLTPRQAAMDACLTLVVTTQLWHHQRFGGGLCRL